ncbi:hypothetical protein [Streptomyces sp. CS014]|uniref:hypothetical protein n=1 Tax=Streptomyces sp. CS014 TaxID=2162707 RepID=UPI000D5174D2|nr:hypothetical protein [Streptomyces sp. CS014]PVD04442.1 hypothetical protein DBP12_03185 [Streptomyces sp. CS014]
MPTRRTPAQITGLAAEYVRAANHATRPPTGLPKITDTADTTLSLATLVDRLPQLIDQLGKAVHLHHQQGTIRMDDHTDPGKAAAQAMAYLAQAHEETETLSKTLHHASALLGHMGVTEEGMRR